MAKLAILSGQNDDLRWGILLSSHSGAAGITLKKTSNCYLGHLSNYLLTVSCISGTFCGAPRKEVRSCKMFLTCLIGSWKIQK